MLTFLIFPIFPAQGELLFFSHRLASIEAATQEQRPAPSPTPPGPPLLQSQCCEIRCHRNDAEHCIPIVLYCYFFVHYFPVPALMMLVFFLNFFLSSEMIGVCCKLSNMIPHMIIIISVLPELAVWKFSHLEFIA